MARAPSENAAKKVREDGETWEEGGFKFLQVFGRAELVGPVNLDEYTIIASDEGEQIDWLRLPTFMGTYLGNKVVRDVESLQGTRDVTLMLLQDTNGVKRAAWCGYILEDACKKLSAGAHVVISYRGEKDFGKSGQSMKAFDVFSRNPG